MTIHNDRMRAQLNITSMIDQLSIDDTFKPEHDTVRCISGFKLVEVVVSALEIARESPPRPIVALSSELAEAISQKFEGQVAIEATEIETLTRALCRVTTYVKRDDQDRVHLDAEALRTAYER